MLSGRNSTEAAGARSGQVDHLSDGKRQHAEGDARHPHDHQSEDEGKQRQPEHRDDDSALCRKGLELQQDADDVAGRAEEQRVAEAHHAVLAQQQTHAQREDRVDSGLREQRQHSARTQQREDRGADGQRDRGG